MNYIAEINVFNQWLETHYLSTHAQLLWYKFMNLFNKTGWQEWVQVDNLRLMVFINAGSYKTALKARDELIEKGLLTYVKGKKGQPNSYKMISLTDEKIQCKIYTKNDSTKGRHI